MMQRIRTLAPYVVAASFGVSAVVHLVKPAAFRPLIPPVLPKPDAWIYASGVAEAVCAAGLATGQPWAGRAGAAILVGVLPGNVQMALDAGTGRNPGPADSKLVAWGRLPLQVPLIWAALQSRPRR